MNLWESLGPLRDHQSLWDFPTAKAESLFPDVLRRVETLRSNLNTKSAFQWDKNAMALVSRKHNNRLVYEVNTAIPSFQATVAALTSKTEANASNGVTMFFNTQAGHGCGITFLSKVTAINYFPSFSRKNRLVVPRTLNPLWIISKHLTVLNSFKHSFT